MPDLTLTTGGAAALAAHQAAGTNPFGAGSKIKIGTGQYTPDGSETDLMTAMSPAIEFDVGGVVSSMVDVHGRVHGFERHERVRLGRSRHIRCQRRADMDREPGVVRRVISARRS